TSPRPKATSGRLTVACTSATLAPNCACTSGTEGRYRFRASGPSEVHAASSTIWPGLRFTRVPVPVKEGGEPVRTGGSSSAGGKSACSPSFEIVDYIPDDPGGDDGPTCSRARSCTGLAAGRP